jgi:hypothetical protein
MLPVVVRLHAFQELRMDIMDAMRANPKDAGLRAQFEQAQQDVVATMAKLWALEAQWDSVPGRRRREGSSSI